MATAAYAHDVVILQDDMEIDHGWTVGDVGDDATTGFWSRNVPQVTDAQPGEDHTPAPGTMCWVTDYRAGAGPGVYDVDDGKTTLKSPIFDLTDYVEVRVGYWRWYSNDAGNAPHEDVFKVDITNDNGGTWVNVETVGPTGDEASGGWYYHEFFVADFVTPTSQVQLRFVASDETNPSLVEAVVDDFLITAHDCHVPCPNPLDGDMDGSGSVDGNDIQAFVSAMLGTPTEADLCHGDFTGDGSLDPADVSGMVSKLLGS